MELHPHEVKVLKALSNGEWSNPEKTSSEAGLDSDAVLRAVSWLKTKEFIESPEEIRIEVSLGDEGIEYAKKGLPERRLMNAIGKEIGIAELKKKVDSETFKIGFGWLRKKGVITFSEGLVKIIDSSETEDEKLLILLKEKRKLIVNDLSKKEQEAVEQLKARKNVIKLSEEKIIKFKVTKKGISASKSLKIGDSLSQLTPELITSSGWKNKKFRPYDVSVYVKPEYPAKKHPLQVELERIRRIFISMGFSEISGNFVESSFWNFDALFTAQDHPVRDMHDTFYLKKPSKIDIPGFDRLWKDVAKTHESGGSTGSAGWQYKWDKSKSYRTVLRTHTTAVTARYLSGLSPEDLPVKVFSLGKTFRNESLDYKHLPEFYQVEGIVVDKNATFRNLLSILKEFYDQMGFKVRFRPAYFPYTEMSVEPEVYFEEKGEWIELGGSGIFRPEVVRPLLGFDCPVLAWGLGVDRVVALKLGLKDIRNLYVSDLDWLRKTKTQF